MRATWPGHNSLLRHLKCWWWWTRLIPISFIIPPLVMEPACVSNIFKEATRSFVGGEKRKNVGRKFVGIFGIGFSLVFEFAGRKFKGKRCQVCQSL
ncbi:hypothetical protein CEXT_813081 [Caerostris extrusa]|uniref:Uncharacterized protein n=1 Tax=Caerostris extrusa TaxID=172846 RepID=A0AAV4Y525_CAEEX|nr:hypothetical protein CEXT_813081 [Caerostris extrusa]